MEATYRVNVGDGETIEMTGNPDKLDKIVQQMKAAVQADPDEAWIPAHMLPSDIHYGWSDQMFVVCLAPGDLKPTRLLASYDFRSEQWRTAMGYVENVTHWQPMPALPKEYNRDE